MGIRPNFLEAQELLPLNLGPNREASIVFRDEETGMSIVRIDKAMKPDWTEWIAEAYYILPNISKSYWSLDRAHDALILLKSVYNSIDIQRKC